jgi:hypothetical protein
MKSLYDISWKISEKEYREDKALSQSTLGRFDREGFSKLANIHDTIESPSLTFGKIVDTLITGSQEEFENTFVVSNKILDEETADIVKTIYDNYKDMYKNFIQIPITQVSQTAKQCGFWPADKWSDNARYNGLLKKGDIERYYQLLRQSEDKIVIDNETLTDALKCVSILRISEATRFYFAEDTESVKRFYQLKFKAVLKGIEYKGMLDNCLVDYTNKKIYPIDLKTSSTPEYEFYKSFVKYGYSHQARLYYRLLGNAIKDDEYFKDFEIEDFTFVVVNRYTLTPLTWRFSDTKTLGTLEYGTTKQIVFKDPYELGSELSYYLTHEECKVPIGINYNKTNSLVEYLNKM